MSRAPVRALALCERPGHVTRARSDAPDAAILALTPEAVWACQQRGLAYLRLDDYVSDAAINAFAEELFRHEYAWARWLDETLSERVPDFGRLGFCPARGQVLYLKRILDVYIRPTVLLQRFLAAARPQRLIVFERSRETLDVTSEPPRHPSRPLFARIVPLIAGDAGVEVEVWPDDQPLAWSDARAYATRLATGLRPLRGLAGSIVRGIVQASVHLSAHRGRLAWVGSRGYDLMFAIPRLQQRGFAVISPPIDDTGRSAALARPHRQAARALARQLASCWEGLAREPTFWQPIDRVASPLRSEVGPVLRRWLVDEVPLFWAEYLGARAWLQRHRPAAVIGVEIPPRLASTVFMAAQALTIPRVMAIHHGGYTMQIATQHGLGPIQCDAYLVSCEEEARYYERLTEHLGTFPGARMIPVGSARLEALRAAGSSRQGATARDRLGVARTTPLIVYISTQFRSYYRNFSDGNSSDVAYFELQQRTLRVCAEYSNIQVLYKPFPREYAVNPMPDFIAREIPNARLTDRPVTELMWAADAIVIDFPSTPLHEAALTDKPLLVYAGKEWARLWPKTKDALQQRALVSETPEEFEAQVRAFLTAGQFAPLTNVNQEFLRFVGLESRRQPAADRMADAIEDVVLQRTPNAQRARDLQTVSEAIGR